MKSSEQVAVVGAIDPDVIAAGTVTTGWVSAKLFQNFMAVIMFGTAGSSATLDAKLEQATTSGGGSAKDVGTAITQMLVSDKQSVINLRTEDLDVQGGFDYVRLSMTIAVATSDAGGLLLGLNPRTLPASDNDDSAVVEIVG